MEGVYTGKGRLGEAELGEVVVNAPLKKMAPTSHVINPWCDFTPKLEPVLRQKPNDFLGGCYLLLTNILKCRDKCSEIQFTLRH